MENSLSNKVGKIRRKEGLQNPDDIYELSGIDREYEHNPELFQVVNEFVSDMRKLLKKRFDELVIESKQSAMPIPPDIIAYMEKTGMDLAQLSLFEGDVAQSKAGEYEIEKMENENGLMIVFNLPKPIGQFWWKGGAGLWGEQAIDVDGKVIEWGYFYRKLMDTVWETIGYYESETPLVLRRLNATGQHDPKNFYYVWEASLRK